MSPLAILLLSASMSVDAFAVAVGRGAATNRAKWIEALRTATIFGTVEAITPLLGWLAGIAAAGWVDGFDHWIAFGLLAGVGFHMIYAAVRHEDVKDDAAPRRPSLALLLATAFGTSLDAMAVGLSLAFAGIDLYGILAVCLGVGLTTFLFACVGMMLGKVIGERFGKLAEIVAGLALFFIGGTILIEGLSA